MASGRIRTIKPELLEDEKTAGLSDQEFRLFVGLLLLSDDYGNFRASPNWLGGQIFWRCETPVNTREPLDALARVGLISLYEVANQTYGHVCGWAKHQKIDHPSKPRIPEPSLGKPAELSPCKTSSRDTREPLAQPSETLAPDRDQDQDQDQDQDHLICDGPDPAAEVEPAETKPEPVIDPPKPPKPFEAMTGREQVIATYFAEYERARGEKPPMTGREWKSIDTLVGVLDGNHGRAMTVIRNAFADLYWQGKITINKIANDPAKFDGQVLQFDRKKPVVQSGGWQMDEEENERKLKELFESVSK